MPGVFDRGLVNRIQQANDIIDVVAEHVSLTKKGREMVGLCPFHDDHRPSMNVNPTKQIFKCFACGAGGDVFKFIQMRENLTFGQAIERLARRAGIELKPAKQTGQKGKPQSADIDPNQLAKVNAWAARHFQKNLYDEKTGKFARDYIAGRKITPDDAKKWLIGLAAGSGNDLAKAAERQKIGSKLLAGAGLVIPGSVPLRDKFVNRLMFPIADVTGRLIGFGGRTLSNTGPKYINSPATALFDKSNCLYGLNHARHKIVENNLAVVVEGYTDCIMAHSKSCQNVVASMGTSFTEGQAKILRRYAARAVLVFDSDTAGIEAANRALEICLSRQIDIKLAFVPQGNDPCDFLISAGKEKFEHLVGNAVDVFRFKWDRLTKSLDTDETFAGKKTAIQQFLQTIAASMHSSSLSAIDTGLQVNRLARIIGTDSRQINAELSKILNRAKRSTAYRLQNQKAASLDLGQGLFAAAQREILEVLLNEPQHFELLKNDITADDFDVPILSRIAAVVFETLKTEPKASLNSFLAGAEQVELGGTIVQLAQAGEQKANFTKRLLAAMEVIQQLKNQKQKTQIKATGDSKAYLRHVSDTVAKQNPHSIGMT